MVDILDVIERDGESVALGSYQFLGFLQILGLLIDESASFQKILEQFLDTLSNRIFNLSISVKYKITILCITSISNFSITITVIVLLHHAITRAIDLAIRMPIQSTH